MKEITAGMVDLAVDRDQNRLAFERPRDPAEGEHRDDGAALGGEMRLPPGNGDLARAALIQVAQPPDHETPLVGQGIRARRRS